MPNAIQTELTQRAFMLAGNATFTLVSKKSGQHLTFKVRQPDETSPHFVSVLTGPENTGDFTFLGTIFGGETFRHGRKSRITPDAPSARAFAWLWSIVGRGAEVSAEVAEFLPSSSCCRCGRKLTHPASIGLAYGPECAKHMGLA